MAEHVQHLDPTHHLHPGFHLHGRSNPHSVEAIGHGGAQARRRRQGKGLNGESGGHVFGASGVDVAGGNEHESDLIAGVEKLERAIVVGEEGSVGISDGGVLSEGEIDGAVGNGE